MASCPFQVPDLFWPVQFTAQDDDAVFRIDVDGPLGHFLSAHDLAFHALNQGSVVRRLLVPLGDGVLKLVAQSLDPGSGITPACPDRVRAASQQRSSSTSGPGAPPAASTRI